MTPETNLDRFSLGDLLRAIDEDVDAAVRRQANDESDEVPWTEYLEYVHGIVDELRRRLL